MLMEWYYESRMNDECDDDSELIFHRLEHGAASNMRLYRYYAECKTNKKSFLRHPDRCFYFSTCVPVPTDNTRSAAS